MRRQMMLPQKTAQLKKLSNCRRTSEPSERFGRRQDIIFLTDKVRCSSDFPKEHHLWRKKDEFSGNVKRAYHRIRINADDLLPDPFIFSASWNGGIFWKGEPV